MAEVKNQYSIEHYFSVFFPQYKKGGDFPDLEIRNLTYIDIPKVSVRVVAFEAYLKGEKINIGDQEIEMINYILPRYDLEDCFQVIYPDGSLNQEETKKALKNLIIAYLVYWKNLYCPPEPSPTDYYSIFTSYFEIIQEEVKKITIDRLDCDIVPTEEEEYAEYDINVNGFKCTYNGIPLREEDIEEMLPEINPHISTKINEKKGLEMYIKCFVADYYCHQHHLNGYDCKAAVIMSGYPYLENDSFSDDEMQIEE